MSVHRFLAAGQTQILNAAQQTGEPQLSSAGIGPLLSDVFRYGIVGAGILAAIYLSLAGFQYMTTDAFTKKMTAKGRIREILTGLFIALCSVLILQVINPATLTVSFARIGQGGVKVGAARDASLNQDYILTGTGASVIPPSGGTGETGGTGAPISTSGSGNGLSSELSAQQVDTLWRANGITVKANSNVGIQGLREIAAIGTVAIKRAIGIDTMVITGAREGGHTEKDSNGNQLTYTHGQGYKVDIGQNSNSGNWQAIDSYFGGLVGGTVAVGKSYTVNMGVYNLKILKHGSALHYDLAFIPH